MGKMLMLASAVCAVVSAQALELGSPFSDGAVLQRDMKVPVWGEADPSARVTVSFAGQVRETTADAGGAWRVDLSPLSTSAEGRTMTVTSGPSKIEVRDVLVGEVWLCAGQSNMDAPLWNTTMHYADAKGGLRGQMTRKPLVRYCSSGQVASIRPLRKTKSKCTWRKFLPENLGGGWPHFSAVGFYFALELHNALGVPVGVVRMSWGGTTIRAWTPPEGMRSVAATRSAADQELLEGAAFQRKVDEAKARGDKYLPEFHQQPSAIWNGQVHPFAPMAARGLVWYQGETDNGMGRKYADWLHALYNGWTKAFENPALKMRFTQLAPAGGGNLAPIMEGQAAFAREEPNAEMSVISDRGAIHDWHPTDKETVGMRLAALALKYDYGWKDLKADAPSLRSWRLEGNRFVLSFDHAEGWLLYNEDWSNDNLFEIAGTNGVWRAATIANMKVKERKPYMSNGQIDGKDLVVFSPEVTEPAHLRYHYQRPQVRANLFNEVGLPLGPLHVDVGSPKDVDVVAVYYPHWHRYPKGTEWFGEKWNEGEWDFVRTAVPRYPGHRAPMKPLPGYLNGRDPKDVETEIALASNAGIDVFLYDYYYYGGKVTQEEAIEEGFLRAENRHLMKFALMWCFHDRRDQFRPPVDRKDRRMLMKLDRTPEEFLGLIDLSIARYFGRPEYWRRDGKLFFSIFGGGDFISSLGKDAAAGALKEARRRVAAAGLGGIHFNAQGLQPDRHDLAREVGFDSLTDYTVVPSFGPDSLMGYEDQMKACRERWAQHARGSLPYMPVVPTGWDCSPRCALDAKRPWHSDGWAGYPYVGIVTNSTPEKFERLLRDAKAYAENDPKGMNAVYIDAWNEYTECPGLLPTVRECDFMLRAVARVFGRKPADRIVGCEMKRWWDPQADNGRALTFDAPTFENVKYGSHCRQGMDVWLPKDAKAPVPCIVYIHGGAWMDGTRLDGSCRGLLDLCRKEGVALATVSYRMIPDALDAGIVPPVRAPVDDAIAAVRLIESRAAEWKIDPSRLGLTGGSAGACSSLIAALTDGNALGIRAVLANVPQTTLDPKEMREWIPNAKYGAHAFGFGGFEKWLEGRESILPWIETYSPAALARRIDPKKAPRILYSCGEQPKPGELAKDPTHAPQFCARFEEICRGRGIACRAGTDADLVAVLKGPGDPAITSETFEGRWTDADAPRSPLEKPGWTLTFSDDFDGVHLKDRNWFQSYRAGRKDWFRRMGIASRFDDPDANYVIEDGILKLRIDRDKPLRPEPKAAAVSSIQTSDYRVGKTTNDIQRLDKFAQKYGWWEIRCRMPKGDGLHAAFWLTHADPLCQEYTLDNRRRGSLYPQGARGKDSTVEIDIFEALGRYERQLDLTVLFPNNRHAEGHFFNHGELPFDWSKHFHTYALEWEEGQLTWYVDGQKYWRYRGPTPQKEMMILLGMYQLGANPKFAGWLKPTPDDLPYPLDFEIDYVRVYSKAKSQKADGRVRIVVSPDGDIRTPQEARDEVRAIRARYEE